MVVHDLFNAIITVVLSSGLFRIQLYFSLTVFVLVWPFSPCHFYMDTIPMFIFYLAFTTWSLSLLLWSTWLPYGQTLFRLSVNVSPHSCKSFFFEKASWLILGRTHRHAQLSVRLNSIAGTDKEPSGFYFNYTGKYVGKTILLYRIFYAIISKSSI